MTAHHSFRHSSKPSFEELVAEAKSLGLDVTALGERDLAAALSAEKSRRWQEENAEAIASFNDWVDKNGLPLAKYRPY